jgi:site-specific recombinase XerD
MNTAKIRYGQYLQRQYGDRSTPKHYCNDLELFIKVIGQKAPQAVTKQDIEHFITSQRERGLKAATINRRLASLHGFFEYLAGEEPEAAWPNPVQWRHQRVRKGDRLPRDGSESEIQRLFAAIDDERDYAMFGLMVGAGLRVGEVTDLQCSNVETPPVAGQASRLRVVGKGRKERIVWLTPQWYRVVKAWMAIRPALTTPELFLNQHGRPLSVAGVQYRLKEYCKRARVNLSCHRLRHTFARRLAEQRMPIESIARLMGHSQVTTTQAYTAGADLALRDAFLGMMAAYEHSAPVAAAPVSAAALPRRTVQPADLAALEAACARLATLPEWLQPTMTAYLRRRWRDWQPDRAAVNADSIARRMRQIWQWLVNERRVTGWAHLQRRDVEAWLDDRTMAGLAVNTRRSQLDLLFSCLRYACDEGHPVAANLFRVPLPVRTELLPRALSPEEYAQLLQTVAHATATGLRRDLLDGTWFLTLAHTGIRTCELLNLRLGDLDLASSRLFVRSGKTGHDRVVFLTPVLAAALACYLAQRPVVAHDHLWIDKDDQPLSVTHVRYRVQAWGEACQLHLSPHRLRHTLATQLVNQGMPLTSIAKLLGHRSLNTTQHYARLYELTVKEQFLTAIQHIEGVAIQDWPAAKPLPLALPVPIPVDSV